MLASLLSGPDETVLVDAGPSDWNGATVNHVRLYRVPRVPDAAAAAAVQQFSAEDLYLDPAGGLPLAVSFRVYPDTNWGVSIAVEIQFSDYRQTDGFVTPTRVRKFLNGSLLLDMNVVKVTVNSGLSPARFSLTSGGAR